LPAVATGTFSEAVHSLLGVRLSRKQVEAFAWLAEELISWNDRFNLTAITDPEQIEVKHFLDSLTCLTAMRPNPAGRVVDVGTGAGFPGLPLKIVLPQLQMTLVEATAKKADFCRHVVSGLGLEGVQILHARAEDVAHQPEHRQSYDWALARAVAQMPVLVEYLLPFLKMGGRAVAQKGETGPEETHRAEPAIRHLGGRVEQILPVELPRVPDTRYLVILRKTAATPDEFPRRPGTPAKRPLT